jgi:hypothetical protein
LSDQRKLSIAFPASAHIAYWPAIRALVETDMPTESFDQKLEEARPILDEALSEWRNNLEQTLVKMLPVEYASGDHEGLIPNVDEVMARPVSSIPEYTLVTGTGLDLQLITSLPPDMQRLLRADSVFMHFGAAHFYPGDFCNRRISSDHLTCQAQPVKIVKALLALLGSPNATYLQMKAAGPVFTCGRCNNGKCMSWKEMVRPSHAQHRVSLNVL